MNTALILSGGTGTRLGSDIPKQYIEVNGIPIISYCFKTIADDPMIDFIQIVADEKWRKFITESCMSEKLKGFSEPGKNRQLSIYNGLNDILKYADENDYVLIHDAARPLVTEKMLSDCLIAAHEHEGSIPVLPMKDTVYMSENGKTISSLLKREKIFAGQAPEAFIIGKYYRANSRLTEDEILSINGSAEPAVLAGMDIAVINGDENNFKITTSQDLERFKNIMGGTKDESMGTARDR